MFLYKLFQYRRSGAGDAVNMSVKMGVDMFSVWLKLFYLF